MTIAEYRRRARLALAALIALALAWAAQSQWLRNGDLLGGSLLILLAGVLFVVATRDVDIGNGPRLTRKQLLLVMTVVMLAGAGVRLWDLASIPQGVWFDEAENGLVATRILTDPSFKPIYISDLTQLPAFFFYYLAGWIAALGSNILAVRLASATLGILTIPGLYLLGRELFSQRVGVIAAFLLSQSRWHVNFSRFGMNGIATPFCLVFGLFFLARAFRTGRNHDFVLGGVTIGVGLNTYLAFNVVPLLVVLWILHLAVAGRLSFIRKYGYGLVLAAVATLLVVTPLALFAFRDPGAFLERTQTASLFADKTPAEARAALVDNVVKHVEMFNYRGDSNGRHNLSGAPELDDLTGALFVIGIVLAMASARSPRFSLLLLWLVILLLPGILSLDFEAPQSYRGIGVVPVVALLAALPIECAWQVIWRWFGTMSIRALDVLAGAALLSAAFANFHTYWFQQIWDNASWAEFSTQETLIAREINRLGSSYTFFLDPVFLDVPTIQFLSPQLRDPAPFDPAASLPFRGQSGVAVFSSDLNVSWINAVHQNYPNALYRAFAVSPGAPSILYEAILSPTDVQAVQGLDAAYSTGPSGDAKLALRRIDKSIDFPWSRSPPVSPPFTVTWSGTLKAPTYGDYVFRLDGPPGAQLRLDQAPLAGTGEIGRIRLAQGTHSLEVTAALTAAADVRLSWQPPGGLLQVVPSDVLFTTAIKNRGLEASYYPNASWGGSPTLQRVDPDVSKHYHLLPLDQPFTVEWSGKIDAPVAGIYRFATQSIDSSWLWVDGKPIVDNSHQPDQYVEGALNLSAGLHDLRIRFLDQSGRSFIDVYWQPPGGPRTLLPGDRVFPPMGAYPERAGPLQLNPTPYVLITPSESMPAAAAARPVTPAPVLPPPQPASGSVLGTLPTSTYTVKQHFGAKGAGAGQIAEARGVAVGPDDTVAVVDATAKRVLEFDGTGKLLRTIGSPGDGDGQFTDPSAAVFDAAGNLLVLDSETSWVQRFDPDGKFNGKFGGPKAGFYHPRGIGLDALGNVYLADTGTGRIIVFNASGEQAKALGEHGTKPGQLQEPVGVAIAADGSIYVVDPTAKLLSRYDSSFQLMKSWDLTGTDTVNAGHVAVSGDGNVFVSDPANQRIIHLDQSGQPVDQLGGPGTLERPVGIAVDTNGNVFVADSQLDQVIEFSK